MMGASVRELLSARLCDLEPQYDLDVGRAVRDGGHTALSMLSVAVGAAMHLFSQS